MKATRATVEEYANSKGLEPVQIDSIPEGFSFKEPDITIAGVEHKGQYIAFFPLSEWSSVKAETIEQLLQGYKQIKQ